MTRLLTLNLTLAFTFTYVILGYGMGWYTQNKVYKIYVLLFLRGAQKPMMEHILRADNQNKFENHIRFITLYYAFHWICFTFSGFLSVKNSLGFSNKGVRGLQRSILLLWRYRIALYLFKLKILFLHFARNRLKASSTFANLCFLNMLKCATCNICCIFFIKGRLVMVKCFDNAKIDLSRDMLVELKEVREVLNIF